MKEIVIDSYDLSKQNFKGMTPEQYLNLMKFQKFTCPLSGKKFEYSKEQKKFPDILVSMQEGYAPSNIHSEFIYKNNDWKYPFNLKSFYKDIYPSCKSYKPLLAIINNKYPFEKFKYKKKDLTFLYHYLNYYLEQLEKDKRKK